MKKQAPKIFIVVRVMFCLIIVFAVLLLIALATRIFGTMSKPIFYAILGGLILSVALFFGLKFSKPYKNAKAAVAERLRAERELLRAVDEMEAIASGEVYCTEEQAKIAFNLLDYNRNDRTKKCPVCDGELQYSDDFEFVANVTVNEKVDGLFIQRGYSNQVEQAYQVIQKEVAFPALICFCPSCEWELQFAEYTSYDFDSDGSRYNRNYKAKRFFRGKLYKKVGYPGMEGSGTFRRK